MNSSPSISLLAALTLLGAACGPLPGDQDAALRQGKHASDHTSGQPVEISEAQLAAFPALPQDFHTETSRRPELIELGRQLYFDPRLSSDDSISCNSCHGLDRFGVDGEATSPGVGGTRGDRNSPTVFMAAGHSRQFWDGRDADVEAQAKGPILNPIEMAMPSAAAVEAKLRQIEGYVAGFSAAFPDADQPVTYDNLATAIGSFERGLVTPAPWDRFVNGWSDALDEQQKRGFATFNKVGCQTCHSGALFGGQLNQKLGLLRPWPNSHDRGIGALANDSALDGHFKVPSLRNITRTGPYLHDGSITELDEVVRMMAKHQLDRELTHQQVRDIVAFLGALEGEADAEYIRKPTLP